MTIFNFHNPRVSHVGSATIGSATDPPARRLQIRRWVTTSVASSIAVLGFAMSACGERDGNRQPSSETSSSKGPVHCAKPRCWWFHDPRVVEGARGALIR
jgi:hypothetical protein